MSFRVPSVRRLGRPRRPPRALALLALVGPGLIAANAGNDAGGVATYAQAGQNYGTSLLWTLLLLVPVLIVNDDQEPARLDVFDGVFDGDVFASDRLAKRVEVHYERVNVLDAVRLNLLLVLGVITDCQQPSVYFGVQRLDPTP